MRELPMGCDIGIQTGMELGEVEHGGGKETNGGVFVVVVVVVVSVGL